MLLPPHSKRDSSPSAVNTPIAVISSTISPPRLELYDGNSARWSPAERLEQTRASIQSLLDLGISEIYLADNSGANWREDTGEKLRPSQVRVFNQHSYRNKGISELYLLLAMLPHLPTGRPIIKLSGRYRLKRRLDNELGDRDLVVREWAGRSRLQSCASTVCYAVRDARTHERFLRDTLRDVFGFPSRIAGPRSLLRIMRNSLFPSRDLYPYDDPQGSIEHAAWRALRKGGYRVRAVQSLGVEGLSGQAGEQLIV